ncbi:FecR domain-containing protein [Synergistaceae bacterium OttesenSCG-928-I11]|nr:FecR domain-containing protein [Synergistaceae bacterium OttesenSCG-928-I11]
MTHRTGFKRAVRLLFMMGLIVCAFAMLAGEALAAESKGKVEESTPGFWVMREDKRIDLNAGDDIYEFDIIMTDATGAGTIRFIDDTVLEVRNSTELDVKEVVFTEERNRFNVGVMEGTARVITGAIVRQNPRGFKVTTPKSTIGIRGTDLSAGYDSATGSSRLSVTTAGSVVTYTETLSGLSVGVGADSIVEFDAVTNTMTVTTPVGTVSFDPTNIEETKAALSTLGNSVSASKDGESLGGSDAAEGGGGNSSSSGGEGGEGNGTASAGGTGGGTSGGDCNDNTSSPGN